MRKGLTQFCVVGLAAIAISPVAAARTYIATPLGLPQSEDGMSIGSAINARGEVTGSLWTSISTLPSVHAFLYSRGSLIALEESASSGSAGLAINDDGQVAGVADGRAFVYSNGSIKVLEGIGEGWSAAYGINAAGHITGYFARSDAQNDCFGTGFVYSNGVVTKIDKVAGYAINEAGMLTGAMDVVLESNATPTGLCWNHAPHAFVRANGVLKDLGTFGGCCSTGHAINIAGEIVGEAYDSQGKVHAFRYKGAALQMLDLSGAVESVAAGINDKGEIVGARFTSQGGAAFYYLDGTMYDLNEFVVSGLGAATLFEARGINNNGQILANGCAGRVCQAYRLDPIPVAATASVPTLSWWCLVTLMGLVVLVGGRRYQRT